MPSWFVAVEKIKPQLLACNAETYWVPSYVKDKRFHAWLEGAHDWAVSRSRFWGTPIPVWASADGEEVAVIGSVAELEARVGGGVKVADLHRHFVDDLEIPSSRGPGHPPLRRVEDVFDCWFESGSMPYGQLHYPFENKERFERCFPADFVAEGLDQTRGWFYTLMVLSTALFGRPAFRNLVCNGLVLAADGKKMSKRLKNYPVGFFFWRWFCFVFRRGGGAPKERRRDGKKTTTSARSARERLRRPLPFFPGGRAPPSKHPRPCLLAGAAAGGFLPRRHAGPPKYTQSFSRPPRRRRPPLRAGGRRAGGGEKGGGGERRRTTKGLSLCVSGARDSKSAVS